MQKIYVFDFDGTITTRDTLFMFLKFTHGRIKYYRNLLLLSPIFVAFALKLISNEKAKQIVFKFFYKNFPKQTFDKFCFEFIVEIDKVLNIPILHIINNCISQGNAVYIVSASIENWIIPWANSHHISNVVATQIQVANNLLTGNFGTKNCYGPEKVKRLTGLHSTENLFITAYGDSVGDKQMLAFANEGYWINKNKITKYEKQI